MDIPPLPPGCSEFGEETTSREEQPLDNHLNDISAINEEICNRLKRLVPTSGKQWNEQTLKLTNLLRRRSDGSHALHPRVIQILDYDEIDNTLDEISEASPEYISHRAYHYPSYIAEYRENPSRYETLYPPEYSIWVLDAVRDLRANRVVTSIRRRGQCRLNSGTLERIVQELESEGTTVEGAATLMMGPDGDRGEYPLLLVEDGLENEVRQSTDNIRSLCETLKFRFMAPVDINIASNIDSSATHP